MLVDYYFFFHCGQEKLNKLQRIKSQEHNSVLYFHSYCCCVCTYIDVQAAALSNVAVIANVAGVSFPIGM